MLSFKIKTCVVCFTFFLFSEISFAQNPTFNLIPLSPTAAEMSKYGETPVNNFTGVPNISIPFYTIKSGELILPIGLDYHAGGNKLEAIATWVGLGWTLSSIPVISRSVNSNPDEGVGGYLSNYGGKTVKEWADLRGTKQEYELTNFLNSVRSGNADSEPDIYYYSLGAKSGKFYYSQQAGKYVTNPYTNLIITGSAGNFTITDDDGTVYDFSEKEYTSVSASSPGPNIVTSLFITSIVSATKVDTIAFSYEMERYAYKTLNSTYKTQVLNGASCVQLPVDNSSIMVNTVIEAKVLKEIKFRGGKIKFQTTTTFREDLINNKALDKLAVYDGEGTEVKALKFNYGYVTSGVPGCSSVIEGANKWMFLNEIYNINSTGVVNNRYSFEYDVSNMPPCRYSTAQDYWGYYNGQTSNNTLIPTTVILGTTIPGANREVNEQFAKFGLLKKITYPTGGSTEFKFEGNEVLENSVPKKVGGMRIREIIDYSMSGIESSRKLYLYQLDHTASKPITSGLLFSNETRTFFNVFNQISGTCNVVYAMINSYSNQTQVSHSGSIVGYKKVYIKLNGLNSDMESYEYTFEPDIVQNGYPYPPLQSMESFRGQLKEKMDYKLVNGIYVPVKKLINEYTKIIYDKTTIDATFGIKIGDAYSGFGIGSAPVSSDYYLYSGWSAPKSKNEIIYDNLDQAKTFNNTTDFTYTTPENQLRSKVTKNSNNVITTNNYFYPSDSLETQISPDIRKWFRTNNITTTLIKQEFKVNSTLKAKTQNFFTNFNGTNLVKLSETVTDYYNPADQINVKNNLYDDFGNVLELEFQKGLKTSYRWGYNKQYPIVVIKNAGQQEFYFQDFEEAAVDFDGGLTRSTARKYTGAYAGLLTNTGTAEITAHSSQYVNIVPGRARMFSYSGWIYSESPSAQLFLFMYKAGETGYYSYVSSVQTTQVGKWVYVTMDALVPADVVKMRMRLDNNGLGKVYFDDLRIRPMESDMSTFTYKPLVGMLSRTDNKGNTIFYEYDEFLRLKAVKNQNQQILQTNSYHFKN